MHTVPSTWGFAFGNACIRVCHLNWRSPEQQQQAKRKGCLVQMVESQAWQQVGCRQSWAVHVRAEGGERFAKMAWWSGPQLELIRQSSVSLPFLQLFDGRKIALIQNPFGASLWSQLLFTKSCYSLNSMVFLWSSFLDIISSCLWCYKSGCTQEQKYPSRWLPEFSLQQSTGSARPGHTSNHKL